MQRTTVAAAQMAKDLTNWSALDSPFYFSNGRMTMLATGEASTLNETIPFNDLAEKVQAMLAAEKQSSTDNPVAFGVIPFDERDKVRFVVPDSLKVASNLRPTHVPDVEHNGAVLAVRSLPTAEQYKQAVHNAVNEMHSGSLTKVVLSRSLQIQLQQSWSAEQLLLPLIKQNPHAYNFCANTSANGESSFLAGSSPELLISRQGRAILANPLAGSRKRHDCEQNNQELYNSLLESEKDLNEHAVVVDAVESALQRYCQNLNVPMFPSVISTPTMLHLSTRLEGTLNDPSVSVLEVAMQLHPTPAVCGQSVNAARRFIKQSEPFERGYFSGLVGWCDARGNGEWVVLIRCGEVKANSLTAYAGAGIVPGSDPEEELLETANKMRTVLCAANLCPSIAIEFNQADVEARTLEVAL